MSFVFFFHPCSFLSLLNPSGHDWKNWGCFWKMRRGNCARWSLTLTSPSFMWVNWGERVKRGGIHLFYTVNHFTPPPLWNLHKDMKRRGSCSMISTCMWVFVCVQACQPAYQHRRRKVQSTYKTEEDKMAVVPCDFYVRCSISHTYEQQLKIKP